MYIIRAIPELRAILDDWRDQKLRLALVPTMGNLHAGHLRLVEVARAAGDRVLVTIFVNPIQFVAGEDYAEYPRTEAEDCRLLAEQGADLVFMPAVATMFPEGLERHTRVTVPELDNILCGAFRPGHFTGVATIVAMLLNLTQPQVAVFGEKDYQQLLVIRRLVGDLAIPVEIAGVPTVREADGLAMSSRNAYLSAEERRCAPLLYRTLIELADRIAAGRRDYPVLEEKAMQRLRAGGFRPEYVSVRDAGTLGPPASGALCILAAAWLGRARLIDNLRVGDPQGQH
jgi:pantoate--beta-alanine ligase